jgi:uncharacterized membrane protein
MSSILNSLKITVTIGFALTILLLILVTAVDGDVVIDQRYWAAISRYLHVISGVMWIGLLWYFNFVQIPSMPKIPDDQKPAIGKVIAPEALFWFRWAAMATLITGLTTLFLNYSHSAALNALTLTLYDGFIGKQLTIGIGMWLAIIMAYNVWMIIWPNQKRALGIVESDPQTKTKSAATAKTFSRINTMLSIPMLLAMVLAQNIY